MECKFCGCSDLDPCIHANGLPCSWARPEVCTLCDEKLFAAVVCFNYDMPPEFYETLVQP